MRRFPFFFFAILISVVSVDAQIPQFAVVRPDGTTYICPSWDSAYIRAQDGDAIYLPGTAITTYNTGVNKALAIIGAGHYPDSTQATGTTSFGYDLNIFKPCYLEGFTVTGNLVLADTTANGSTIKRVKSLNAIRLFSNNNTIDGCVSVSIIVGDNCLSISQNNLIKNTIIGGGGVNLLRYTSFQNCIFFSTNSQTLIFTNCNFYNCIFKGEYTLVSPNNCLTIAGINYYNCVFTQASLPFYDPNTSGSSGNYFSVNPDLIFVNQSGCCFSYQHNYHLLPNSPYLTAGTDGTQIGIYGGSTPYEEGAVPSNPHLYFKQVSTQTNSNGQLQIQFKVRTNN